LVWLVRQTPPIPSCNRRAGSILVSCSSTDVHPSSQESDVSATPLRSEAAPPLPRARTIDFKLEVVVIPVADVDRAKRFYADLGWRLDADFVVGSAFRVVQFTPPGSSCSVHFGTGLTAAAPGSARGLYLVVSDIQGAHAELARRGADVGEIYHQGIGEPRSSGVDPERSSYFSYATFRDPDGNEWLLQEVTTRFAGRIDGDDTKFASTNDLASALRRAEAAHIEHEKRTGQRDANWPEWYAAYMVREQTGESLPT
jgi:catechol 2,3-dioxygenase-like lactoylglutathione lyase family enzyme